jgi:competence protein ComEC
LTLYQPQLIEPGQRWRWKLRLRPPHGFANPGGFDYEAWLLEHHIAATGYVREIPTTEPLQAPATRRLFEQTRLHFIRFIEAAHDGELRYPHLLRALTVGDGSAISDAEWQLFADTGTTHLLVISGSHVALICLWLFAIGYWLSSRSAALVLRIPASSCAALLALPGAWMYTGLAGFSLPALRALVMAALVLLAVLQRRHCSAVNNLCLALALILMFDPLAAQNPGFWLSFAAVAVLLHAGSPVFTVSALEQPRHARLRKVLHNLGHFMVLQWKLSLALLPILLLYFQQTSLLAPLVNLLTIPLIGWLIVPLALVGLITGLAWPWAGGMLLVLSDWLLHGCLWILHQSTTLLPVNTLILPALSLAGMLLLVATTVCAIWLRQRRQRFIALALLPLSFLLRAPALPAGSVRVTVLDVGQGLAVLVSTRQHHMLYDTGPHYSSRFDAGSDVVLPAVRSHNISRLDTVVVSHADADHAGGLAGIVEAFPQAHYLGPATGIFPAEVSRAPCREGDSWQWDGVMFRFLHPDERSYDDNNGSCVLLIEAGGRRLLLPGDIERRVEPRLLRSYPDLRADVVVAPHHGSRSSSSFAFVRQLDPTYVVFSSGYQNRFNHPAPEVVARYQAQGSQGYQTARSGAVTFLVSPEGALSMTEQRLVRRRFWIGQPQ